MQMEFPCSLNWTRVHELADEEESAAAGLVELRRARSARAPCAGSKPGPSSVTRPGSASGSSSARTSTHLSRVLPVAAHDGVASASESTTWSRNRMRPGGVMAREAVAGDQLDRLLDAPDVAGQAERDQRRRAARRPGPASGGRRGEAATSSGDAARSWRGPAGASRRWRRACRAWSARRASGDLR